MTPRAFLDGFVKPNFEIFRANQNGIAFAFNAAVPAAHLVDHCFYFKHGPPDGEKHQAWVNKLAPELARFRSDLQGKCRGLALVRHVSEMYKHLYTNPNRSEVEFGSPGQFGVDAMSEIKFSSLESLEGGNSVDTVIYRAKTGETKRLVDDLRAVVDWWEKYLPPEDR